MRRFVVLVVAVLLLSACSGVPTGSKVDVVRSGVGTQGTAASQAYPGPKKGLDPRGVVLGFLQAELSGVSAARQYLTTDAQRRWQGQITTVLRGLFVGLPEDAAAGGQTVSITGNLLGSVAPDGVYTAGSLAPSPPVNIGLQQVDGQWRISNPPPQSVGVLVSESNFDQKYVAHPIFYLNASGDRVVPDVRYSVQRGQALAQWLLQQLVGQSRPDIGTAVTTEIPDQTDVSRLSITIPDPTSVRIDFPGLSQLDGPSLRRFAAQLAYTLDAPSASIVAFLTGIYLTDGRRAVDIPGVGESFRRSDFPTFNPDSGSASGGLYYIQGGGLISEEQHRAVAGEWGVGTLDLKSAAVQDVSGTQEIVAVGSSGKVYIGPAGGSATPVAMPAAVGRPQWQPDTRVPTAWVPTAAGMYRVVVDGQSPTASAVPLTTVANSPLTGTPSAFVLAPGGTRVAVLINKIVWVGSLVSSGTNVAAQYFVPVTPSSANKGVSPVTVADVTYADSTHLWVIATFANSGSAAIYRMSADGQGLGPSNDSVPSGGLSDNDPVQLASPTNGLVIATADGVIWSYPDNSGWIQLTQASNKQASSPTYELTPPSTGG